MVIIGSRWTTKKCSMSWRYEKKIDISSIILSPEPAFYLALIVTPTKKNQFSKKRLSVLGNRFSQAEVLLLVWRCFKTFNTSARVHSAEILERVEGEELWKFWKKWMGKGICGSKTFNESSGGGGVGDAGWTLLLSRPLSALFSCVVIAILSL